MIRTRFVPRSLATVTATAAVMLGGAIATAPTASAADSSSCDSARYTLTAHINTNGVNLRSGPGTKYTSKGLLSKGTKDRLYCHSPQTSATVPYWDYIKVTTGPNKNIKGWVRDDLNSWL
ncbi:MULTISPECIES: hypothetical protein [unclassified Streptomyces]|uniref:hypothetical protein n=1 Tax=unclassified Streptomyces TaxID=2593676 RepID=UPI0033AA217C